MFDRTPRLATMTATVFLFASTLFVAGCSDDNNKDQPSPAATGCTKDTDCKGDRICRHGHCTEDRSRGDHPHPTGNDPPAPTQTAAPPPTQTAAPPPATTVAYNQITSIPTTESPPPTAEEWAAAPFLEGTDNVPKPPAESCTMQLVREWLRLRCEGDLKRVDTDGNKWFPEKPGKNWFENHQYPDWGELIFRLQRGTLAEAYFRRVNPENSARFYTDWSRQNPKPQTLFLKKWKL